MNGKMLILVKTFLQSFVYDIIVFYFLDETVKKIYQKYQIEKCHLY